LSGTRPAGTRIHEKKAAKQLPSVSSALDGCDTLTHGTACTLKSISSGKLPPQDTAMAGPMLCLQVISPKNLHPVVVCF
jgi:hypothetical protein